MSDEDENNRRVTLSELKLLSLETNHKIDTLTEKVTGLVASQGEMRVQVATNTKEIDQLRTQYHDLERTVDVIKGRSEILSTDNRRELAQLLPGIRDALALARRRGLTDVPTDEEMKWLQTAAREIEKDYLKVASANIKHRHKREVRWFGLSREVVIVSILGVFSLLNSPIAVSLWHVLTGK